MCRLTLCSGDAFLAHHVLKLFCTTQKAGMDWDTVAMPEDASAEEPYPPPLPRGLVLAFDRARVAHEFAVLALLKVAGRSAVLGTVIDRQDVFQHWQDHIPLELWAGCDEGEEGEVAPMQRTKVGESTTIQAGQDAVVTKAVQQRFVRSLQGAAVPLPFSGGERLLLVMEQHLAPDARVRFQQLFSVQACWTADELAPYLRRAYDAECKTEAELLLRYTRAVREQPEGSVVHCAR
jgi:hypothetical protein